MISIDAALVSRLISTQFPAWANLPVTPVEPQGWDNATFRIGDKLKARLPRAPGYEAQVAKEATWLPVLAAHLPVRIPSPRATGAPGDSYPFVWSIHDWIEGAPADQCNANDVNLAEALARTLGALRAIDASEGPAAGAHNFHRGGDLSVYDAEAREALRAIGHEIYVRAAADIWRRALETQWTAAPVWVHGDVAAGNILLHDGALGALIDFGCLGVGDPACDLTLAWTLFDGEARETFIRASAFDDACWSRARGWALWKAAITLAKDRGDSSARRVITALIADTRT